MRLASIEKDVQNKWYCLKSKKLDDYHGVFGRGAMPGDVVEFMEEKGNR